MLPDSLRFAAAHSPVWRPDDESLIDAFLAGIPTDHLQAEEVQYLRHVGVLAVVWCRDCKQPLSGAMVRNCVRSALLQTLESH